MKESGTVPIRVAVCQVRDVDDALAAFAHALGVTSVNLTTPPLPHDDGYWRVSDLVALREKCEALGLTLEVIENTAHEMYDRILTGRPGREEQLDNYCRTIRNIAAAGIPVLGFHFMPAGVWRTDMAAPARGGATTTAFSMDLAHLGNKVVWPAEVSGLRLTAEDLWENYRDFLDAVLPVAEEVGLLLAQHPDDPPVPEIDGVARIFSTPESFMRAEELSNGSPAWGLDLCVGTVSEMGGSEAVDRMIEHFGPRGKIRYVHFRDVQGTVPSFTECFLGEGNLNPAEVVRQLRAVGFDGWLQDDHVPLMADDTPYGHRSRAHAIGYMQGLINALY